MPEVFIRTIELCIALGWKSIQSLPGCQEYQIDEHWWFAINPHDQPAECKTGGEVPPYSIYFRFNDWPAGVCCADGGFTACGTLANETTLLKALDAAIARLG